MRTEHYYIKTDDIKLISAMTALGFEIKPNGIVKVIKGQGKEHLTFFISTLSNCGKYKAGEIVTAWNDPEFVDNNPEHPFAYIKAAFQNNETIMDLVKAQIPFIQVTANGKTMLIPANASIEKQERMFSLI